MILRTLLAILCILLGGLALLAGWRMRDDVTDSFAVIAVGAALLSIAFAAVFRPERLEAMFGSFSVRDSNSSPSIIKARGFTISLAIYAFAILAAGITTALASLELAVLVAGPLFVIGAGIQIAWWVSNLPSRPK